MKKLLNAFRNVFRSMLRGTIFEWYPVGCILAAWFEMFDCPGAKVVLIEHRGLFGKRISTQTVCGNQAGTEWRWLTGELIPEPLHGQMCWNWAELRLRAAREARKRDGQGSGVAPWKWEGDLRLKRSYLIPRNRRNQNDFH